ncbi:MAG TPA: cytochrome c oxidase subunit II [Ideonella sp.]|nr:cytochrome c oxidase subunit II [Ideonella sp.]
MMPRARPSPWQRLPIAGALVVPATHAADAVLQPAGPLAATLAEMSWVLIAGAAVLFVGVMALLAWALLSARPHPLTPRQARRWLLGGGVLLPAVVLSALLAYTALRSQQLLPASWLASGAPPADPRALVISVTARSWWWEIGYHDPRHGGPVLLANELHLPVGRPVTLGLNSADVIHSFWVPALAGKVDMLPGRVHRLVLQADKPGVYRGPCAEFCGEQHARMVLQVVARPADEFERWLAAQAAPAAPPADALALRGQAVFLEQRCNACHQVRGLEGAETHARLGPDLTHVGSRRMLAAGAVPNDLAHLAAWVAQPQRFKPGVRMPGRESLDDGSLQALAAYLAQLK